MNRKTEENDRMLDAYPDVLVPEEVMKILGIGRSTMYDILQSGELKAVRIGRQYRISKERIKEYINNI